MLRSLARRLPAQVEPALDAPRFSADAAALARFADPGHVDDAAAALSPEEAAWLSELILARWASVAEPVLDPEVAIVAPEEVWVGQEPVRVPLALEALGVDPDWEAVWDGDVAAGPPSRTAVLVAMPPSGSAPVLLKVRARVRVRSGGERAVLLAHATVRVRRPAVLVDADRRRLLVRDQEERPAARVRLELGERSFVTSAAGVVELGEPAAPGTPLRVEGIAAGRVPAPEYRPPRA